VDFKFDTRVSRVSPVMIP